MSISGVNYSGTANFDYEIYRYKCKQTGKLFTENEIYEICLCNDYDQDMIDHLYNQVTIKLEVSGSSYYTAGKYTGRYEDSYPDDGDTEIDYIWGPDNTDWEDKITTSEKEDIIEQIESKSKKSSSDDYDANDYDGDDDYYDDLSNYD